MSSTCSAMSNFQDPKPFITGSFNPLLLKNSASQLFSGKKDEKQSNKKRGMSWDFLVDASEVLDIFRGK